MAGVKITSDNFNITLNNLFYCSLLKPFDALTEHLS